MNAQVALSIYRALVAAEWASLRPADAETIRADVVDALRRPTIAITDPGLAREYGYINTRCSDPVYLPYWDEPTQPTVQGCA